jgi:hypothetical protein
VGDDGRCTGTIADGITSALGCLPDHLCSQVLGGILQVDFFGDGDTIVTDQGFPKTLLNQNALGLRPERHAYGVGQGRRAM